MELTTRAKYANMAEQYGLQNIHVDVAVQTPLFMLLAYQTVGDSPTEPLSQCELQWLS